MKEYRHVVYKGFQEPFDSAAYKALSNLTKHWDEVKECTFPLVEKVGHSQVVHAGNISGTHVIMLTNDNLDTLIEDCMDFAIHYNKELEKATGCSTIQEYIEKGGDMPPITEL